MPDRERDLFRRYLGIHKVLEGIALLQAIPLQLERMERKMATVKQQLVELSAKVDDLIADVRAALNDGSKEALDALSAKVDAFDAEVGDADGSDTAPAPTETETPPVEGGTEESFR